MIHELRWTTESGGGFTLSAVMQSCDGFDESGVPHFGNQPAYIEPILLIRDGKCFPLDSFGVPKPLPDYAAQVRLLWTALIQIHTKAQILPGENTGHLGSKLHAISDIAWAAMEKITPKPEETP